MVYLILSFAALNNKIIYAVLLIDIIKLSDDLTFLWRVLLLKLPKLCKTALLCFVIIYIYSLIGSAAFP